MPLKISTTALSAIENKDITIYGEAKLYDADGVYLTDLDVENVSYSKSRAFNVNSMNVRLVNSDNQYTTGVNKINQDYIIVVIEGYDTTVASDKIPTFRGRVKDINHEYNGGANMLNVTCFGELMLLQRSDLNKIFIADTEYVEDEILTAVIDSEAGTVTDIDDKYIKIEPTDEGLLADIMSNDIITIESQLIKIKERVIAPNTKTTNNEIMVYYTGTNSLTPDETVVSEDGSLVATYKTDHTHTQTGYKYIKLNVTSGTPRNGMIIIGQTSGEVLTLELFYYVSVEGVTDARRTAVDLLTVSNKVHTGLVDKFRAENPNWAAFKVHKINIKMINGDVSKDDRFDGYEISETLGIVKLNQPIKINERMVEASYYYYPVGLYIEDVITDLLLEPDGLEVNIISNGKFKQNDKSWTVSSVGLLSTEYNKVYGNGISLITLEDMVANEYITLTQEINILNGYEYDISFNIEQMTGNGATYGVFINNSELASGADFNNLKTINYTYNSVLSGANNFEIRIYDMDKSDRVRVNDVQINYNPAKINAFTKNNLYCKLSNENGATPAYDLVANSGYITTPKFTSLIEDITIDSTVIKVKSATDLESSGVVKIDNELISYSAVTGNELTIDERGYDGSQIVDHVIGKRVWEVLPAGRVWHMEYNNIIPQTEDPTASDYGYSGAIDLSDSDFTITGSTFDKIYYREGMVITDGVATKVTLKVNTDYTFSHIQSTAIETPYILIDYKNMKNRFDAISEIRSMLAPNYIIDETVRKVGSDYITYIRGRYLTQKLTADYDLKMTGDISYNQPLNNYNRVKMFGKISNPSNLMYSDSTDVICVNNIGSQYLKGVGYNYQYDDGVNYVFSNEIQASYNASSEYNIRTRGIRSSATPITTSYNTITKNIASRDVSLDDNRLVDIKLARIIYNGSSTLGSIDILPVLTTYVATRTRRIGYHKTFKLYNVYYINYTDDEELFKVGDVISDGGNSGIIKRIDILNQNDTYNALIHVEMSRTSVPFTNAQLVTNGLTYTANVYRLNINGFGSYVNYNALQSPTYGDIITFYNYTFLDFNDTVDFQPTDNKFKLYIDDELYNVDNVNWSQEALELNKGWQGREFGRPGEWFGTKFRNRYNTFDNTGLFLNTKSDFEKNFNNKIDNIITAGTVRLEKYDLKTGNIEDLYTINYRNEPNVDIKAGYVVASDRGRILSESLDAGDLTYDARHNNERDGFVPDKLGNDIKNATHVRFTRRFGNSLNYDIVGDFLYINKEDFNRLNLKIDEVKVKVDGEYNVRFIDEYIGTENLPAITRIRNNYVGSRETQVSVMSKTPIEGIDLCIIDLGDVKDVRLIDLQAGFLFKPSWTNDNSKYDVKFQYTLYHCDKDESYENINGSDFELISNETEGIDLQTGDISTLTESELGEYFKTRYIKVRVSTGNEEDITEGLETENKDGKKDRTYMRDYYGASISSIAIYGSSILSSEQYVDADIINLYKDTTVYEELHTQELLDNYAYANLIEFQKDNNRVSISSPIGSHYDMGMTVNLNDTENGINKNYFIEDLASTNGVTTLSLARYE